MILLEITQRTQVQWILVNLLLTLEYRLSHHRQVELNWTRNRC